MTDAAHQAVVTCLQTILRDEAWQDFGFPKRPTRGSFFQRFRPGWKVALEKKVLQEMLSALTAAYVASGVLSRAEAEECVEAYTATPDLARALGYASRDEARRILLESTARYIEAQPDEWPVVLHSRIDPDSVPDRPVAAELFLGCARFGATAQRMVAVLRHRST